MGFVFPQFLWALAALTIPVAIHLFTLRRTVRVYFSDNRFLEQIKRRTGYRHTLKRYLILLARLLFLLFLIIAFAQPFFFAEERNTNTKRVVFYLDNSLSMSLPQNNARAIDIGIEFIRRILKAFPKETRYKLITNEFDASSTVFKTSGEIWDQLTQVELSHMFRSFETIKRRIGSDTSDATLFWISDFQKSIFTTDKSNMLHRKSNWHLIPIAPAKHANIYVDSAYLENPFSIDGKPNRLHVNIAGIDLEKTEHIAVKLIIDNVQSGIATAHITPGASTAVSFDLATNLSGLHGARLHIDDPYLDFDNDFYLTLNFTRTIHIIDIRDDPTNRYMQKVFGNHKIFTYTGFQPDNIRYSQLEKADLIILNGLNQPDDALLNSLQAVLRKKTALLFIPGDKPDLSTYQKLLPWQALAIAPHNDMSSLEKPDPQNPFFESVFEAQDHPWIMPKARKGLTWGDDRSAILRFKDMSPFLSQKNNFFILTCPIQKAYTNFYNHALFVPVMYKIAATAIGKEEALYYALTHKVITLQTDLKKSNIPLRIVGEQQEIVPNQHQASDKIFLEISNFALTPGLYYVQQQQDTLALLAINVDKRESDLRSYLPDEISLLPRDSLTTKGFQVAGASMLTDALKERYVGKPLWREALALALFFLLLETLFIRYLK